MLSQVAIAAENTQIWKELISVENVFFPIRRFSQPWTHGKL